MPTHHPPAKTFISAVLDLERTGSAREIVKLFTDDATLDTIALADPARGQAEIAQFWEGYVAHFKTIMTTFTKSIDTPGSTVLEWRSVGTLAIGTPITYRGVTILDWAGEQVKSFRVYYDSAAFVPEFETHLKRKPMRSA